MLAAAPALVETGPQAPPCVLQSILDPDTPYLNDFFLSNEGFSSMGEIHSDLPYATPHALGRCYKDEVTNDESRPLGRGGGEAHETKPGVYSPRP